MDFTTVKEAIKEFSQLIKDFAEMLKTFIDSWKKEIKFDV